MPTPDLTYLRRIAEHSHAAELLREPKFLASQQLFFATVTALGGTVDFDIADMREVHAVAALGDIQGLKVLDVGCGSTEPYILEDTFRDRYPPFFAEMLAKLGADVTGADIRPNPSAGYRHLTLDCTKGKWMKSFRSPYDVIVCLSLFNAPGSPFEADAALCDRLMDEMHSLLAADGLLIVTLRDDLLDPAFSQARRLKQLEHYAGSRKFRVIHCDENCAWLARA